MVQLQRSVAALRVAVTAGTRALQRQARSHPPPCPTSLEQARRLVAEYVQHYNCVRLHSAHSYIAPMDFLSGLAPQIWAESDRRWEQDRSLRAKHRAQLRGQPSQPATSSAELACA